MAPVQQAGAHPSGPWKLHPCPAPQPAHLSWEHSHATQPPWGRWATAWARDFPTNTAQTVKPHRETQAGVSHLHALLFFLLQPHPMMVTAKRVLPTGLSFLTLKWCQDPSEGLCSSGESSQIYFPPTKLNILMSSTSSHEGVKSSEEPAKAAAPLLCRAQPQEHPRAGLSAPEVPAPTSGTAVGKHPTTAGSPTSAPATQPRDKNESGKQMQNYLEQLEIDTVLCFRKTLGFSHHFQAQNVYFSF